MVLLHAFIIENNVCIYIIRTMLVKKITPHPKIYVKLLPYRLEINRSKNSQGNYMNNLTEQVMHLNIFVNTSIKRIKKLLSKVKAESAIYAKGNVKKGNSTIKWRSIVSEQTILITFSIYAKLAI